jgi:hippurate hydrolase
VIGVFRSLLGEQNVVQRNPEMGGEDFARYGREEPKIPTFMFRVGSVAPARVAESRQKNGRALPSLHSAHYLPDREPTIKTGTVAMTAAALDLLKKK